MLTYIIYRIKVELISSSKYPFCDLTSFAAFSQFATPLMLENYKQYSSIVETHTKKTCTNYELL